MHIIIILQPLLLNFGSKAWQYFCNFKSQLSYICSNIANFVNFALQIYYNFYKNKKIDTLETKIYALKRTIVTRCQKLVLQRQKQVGWSINLAPTTLRQLVMSEKKNSLYDPCTFCDNYVMSLKKVNQLNDSLQFKTCV